MFATAPLTRLQLVERVLEAYQGFCRRGVGGVDCDDLNAYGFLTDASVEDGCDDGVLTLQLHFDTY